MGEYIPTSKYEWEMNMPRPISPYRLVLNDRSGRPIDVYLHDGQMAEVFSHFIRLHTQYAYEEIMKIIGRDPYPDDEKPSEKSTSSSTTKVKNKQNLKLLL